MPDAETETTRLTQVVLWVCDPCLAAEPAECHTPGCALWMHDAPTEDTASALYEHRRFTMDEAVLIAGTPIFGCPACGDLWESEPSCEHYIEATP